MASSPLPALDPNLPISALVAAQVRRTPNAVAVVDGDSELTYGELDARSAVLAARLRAAGAGPDAPVAVCLPRGAQLVVALLAVLRAGAGYLPLDPAYPAERIELIMGDAAAPLVVTDRSHRALAGGATAILVDANDPPSAPGAHEAGHEAVVTLEDRAYVIYTSGSTGRPKGVDVPHRGVNALLRWAAGSYRPDEVTGVLFATSVCFDISVFEVFFPLAVGGTVIVAENALALPDLAARDRVTLVNTVPSAMAALLRGAGHGAGLPASVRVVNLAGEPLPRRLADQVYAQPQVRRLFNLYGPTEDTVYSTCSLVERDEPAEPTIGVPLPGTVGHVLDEQRRPVVDGGIGELFLAGQGLARGYLGRPDLTAERFLEFAGTRMYRTGDLVRRLPDGRLEYHGRTEVKVRGFRVELGEIESVLARFPGVQLAAAVARDDDAGRYLAAFVQAAPDTVDAPGAARALRAAAAGLHGALRAGRAARAAADPNGKVDRKALPAVQRQRDEQRAYVAPRDELEAGIAALWHEVLGVQRIGVHDVFLDLGGHSLLAAAVLSRVQREFGVRVGVGEFFGAPTVAALAARVRAAAPPDADMSGDTVRVVREPSARPAVSAIQREFWVGERVHGSSDAADGALHNVPVRGADHRPAGPRPAGGRAVDRGGQARGAAHRPVHGRRRAGPGRPSALPSAGAGGRPGRSRRRRRPGVQAGRGAAGRGLAADRPGRRSAAAGAGGAAGRGPPRAAGHGVPRGVRRLVHRPAARRAGRRVPGPHAARAGAAVRRRGALGGAVAGRAALTAAGLLARPARRRRGAAGPARRPRRAGARRPGRRPDGPRH
ncbi:MAG TPA: non-ribosomal peptide synthetase [Pseudonocardiaceae bacterium]